MNITFLTNIYDRDGDLVDKGIFIHFGGGESTTIIKFKDLKQLENARDTLVSICEEIKEHWQ